MWLARLPRPPVPEYVYHQILWTYVPALHRQPGAARPFVYRVDGAAIDYLSRYRPACDARAVSPEIVTGRVYQFELLCSPARSTRDPVTGARRGRVFYRDHDERRAWLARRLDGAARILFAQSYDRPPRLLTKGDGTRLRIEECLLRGTLEASDRVTLIERMCQGVGGRGALGHGLLWLPEAMG